MDFSSDDFMRLSAQHLTTVYHVSPDSNIQVLQGRYSPKLRTKGLFVGPKKAIFRSWAGYVSSKKGPGLRYKNLTLYTLRLPKDVYSEARTRYDRAYQKAFDKTLEMFRGDETKAHLHMYAAWDWDQEVFIPEDLLDQVKIAGRKTLQSAAFQSAALIRRPSREYSPKEIASFAAKASRTNPAARLYLDLLNRLQEIAFSRKPKDRYEVDRTRRYVVRLPGLFYDFNKGVVRKQIPPPYKRNYQDTLEDLDDLRSTLDNWDKRKAPLSSTTKQLVERYRRLTNNKPE